MIILHSEIEAHFRHAILNCTCNQDVIKSKELTRERQDLYQYFHEHVNRWLKNQNQRFSDSEIFEELELVVLQIFKQPQPHKTEHFNLTINNSKHFNKK